MVKVVNVAPTRKKKMMATELEIVDAHVHFWSPQTHPWLIPAAEKGGFIAASFTAPEYCKEFLGYNVTQCVHVEAAWSGDPVEETK